MKRQLLETLTKSKDYTIHIAEAMPESLYHFKPVSNVWDFGELFHHMTYGVHWYLENYIRGNESVWNPPIKTGEKKAIISGLVEAFESLTGYVVSRDLSEQAVYGFHATLDHLTHHRAQGVIYLRCNGINPPEYIY